MHNQKVLEKFGFKDNKSYPVAEYLSQNGLYLPSGSGLKREDIEYICWKIKEICRKG